MTTFPAKAAAARVGRLRSTRHADDPELIAARQQLAAANIENAIQRQLDAAPPLTDDQAARLAVLLSRGGAK